MKSEELAEKVRSAWVQLARPIGSGPQDRAAKRDLDEALTELTRRALIGEAVEECHSERWCVGPKDGTP